MNRQHVNASRGEQRNSYCFHLVIKTIVMLQINCKRKHLTPLLACPYHMWVAALCYEGSAIYSLSIRKRNQIFRGVTDVCWYELRTQRTTENMFLKISGLLGKDRSTSNANQQKTKSLVLRGRLCTGFK